MLPDVGHIAVDPAARMLQSVLSSVPATLVVYAGDTAIASAHFAEAGRPAFATFEVLGVRGGVGGPPRQDEGGGVLRAGSGGHPGSARGARVPQAAGLTVVSSANHLGGPAGPCAELGSWQEEPRVLAARARHIKATGRSPPKRLQFRAPDAGIRLAEEAVVTAMR